MQSTSDMFVRRQGQRKCRELSTSLEALKREFQSANTASNTATQQMRLLNQAKVALSNGHLDFQTAVKLQEELSGVTRPLYNSDVREACAFDKVCDRWRASRLRPSTSASDGAFNSRGSPHDQQASGFPSPASAGYPMPTDTSGPRTAFGTDSYHARHFPSSYSRFF
ncbi:hypothetical protein IAU60_002556 [Kwoniella sp. DSM 27419]